MKATLCFLCLVGMTHGATGSVSGRPREVRMTIVEELRSEFRFEPQSKEISGETDDDVFMLPRYEVAGSFIREVELAVRADQQKQAAEKFNWKHGGTFYERGRLRLMLKYAPGGGFKLLQLAW